MNHDFRVMVVDDDRVSRVSTAKQLEASGYSVSRADNAYRALKELEDNGCDVILTDLRMPGMDGIAFLREVKRVRPEVEVILMTAYGSVETAVEAMREGASDYLTKPFQIEELLVRLESSKRLKDTQQELQRLRGMLGDALDTFGLVGNCASVCKVRDRIRVFCDVDAPVLVLGETGTGKELVAQALHREGARSGGPFVAVGCGTIPHDLAESELFGHERGAFTGATQRRTGRFQKAHGGTLLLDDVDDLPLDLQVKLLRVLQEGTFTRVGGSAETEVDVRVVATTKLDLEQAAAEGSFRPDLYYRLRGLEIRLPPLRERGEDLPLLTAHFLHSHAASSDTPPLHLDPSTAVCLRHHPWPGNVRELRQSIESACVLAEEGTILPEHLPEAVQARRTNNDLADLHLGDTRDVDFSAVVMDVERQLIEWAMRRAAGNQAEAARLLQLPRTTLQSKLAQSALHPSETEPETKAEER